MRVLLLGGTTEASRLAATLANAGVDAVFSYAGRTNAPVTQPLPMRIGGFGGIAGLARYIHAENITHVVDATHPFAAKMSANAFEAHRLSGVPLVRFERAPWLPEQGDNWHSFATLEDIAGALPDTHARIFLAIGKQQLNLFATKPQHHYLLRLVDAPEWKLPLPDTQVVLARGPFDAESDTALLRAHRITHVVAKNAGGEGARAKLVAARALGIPVLMAERPKASCPNVADSIAGVMRWLGHKAERGV